MKFIIIAIVCVVAVILLKKPAIAKETGASPSIYDFIAKTIDGVDKPLADYKGKVVLIVNTASRCGFTSQYKGLEAIYEKYKDKGFVVLGFPANNFLGQEPGSNEEIKQFCELKFKTTFPMFAKIDVAGKNIAPLYKYLTNVDGFKGNITWNFNKFLISKEGQVVARFDSKVKPEDREITEAIEKVL